MTKIFRSFATLLALAIGAAGVLLVLFAWNLPPFHGSVETTTDAYVRGQVALLSPQFSGYVVDVPVQDYQHVKAGDLLVALDDRIAVQNLEKAKAALAKAKADLDNSEQSERTAEAGIASRQAQLEGAQAALASAANDWQRKQSLQKKGIVTESDADKSRSSFDQATAAVHAAEAGLDSARQELAGIVTARASLRATVKSAEAGVRLAEIDLENTKIRAPSDGTLGEVSARVGQYVSTSSQLVALVPDHTWVVANYKETQLAGMAVGQKVLFTVDALGDAELTGRIERFAPATGSEFSVLRPDNATGNFTKIAQRLPVRIAIDPGQPLAERLVPGMSVVARVDVGANADGALATAFPAGRIAATAPVDAELR
ncbi:HlyD family secretion protein [Amorphus sp. MBR-141]